MKVYLDFDCPYCTKLLRIKMEELAPHKVIQCSCGKQIPAGVLYDNPEDGQSPICMEQEKDSL